jgi:hypothetical protein
LCQNDWFIEVGRGGEEFKTKQEICAKHLIRNLSQSISDGDKVLTGITLQCRTLAEAFDKELKTFFHPSELRATANCIKDTEVREMLGSKCCSGCMSRRH